MSAPVRDELKPWETKAAAQFKLDGDDAGWDSDEPEEETQEEKYIKVAPCLIVRSSLRALGHACVSSPVPGVVSILHVSHGVKVCQMCFRYFQFAFVAVLELCRRIQKCQ